MFVGQRRVRRRPFWKAIGDVEPPDCIGALLASWACSRIGAHSLRSGYRRGHVARGNPIADGRFAAGVLSALCATALTKAHQYPNAVRAPGCPLFDNCCSGTVSDKVLSLWGCGFFFVECSGLSGV